MDTSERSGRDEQPAVPPMQELARLWVRVQPAVSAYVSANVSDMHHADDLVQEVAQTVAEKFSEYDRQRPFTSWVLGIARIRILKYYRACSRDRLVLSEPVLERLADAIARTEDQAEDRRDALRNCLERVSGKRRELIESRYRNGERVVDIAARLGVSAAAVSVMLFRVRKSLMACIQARLSNAGA